MVQSRPRKSVRGGKLQRGPLERRGRSWGDGGGNGTTHAHTRTHMHTQTQRGLALQGPRRPCLVWPGLDWGAWIRLNGTAELGRHLISNVRRLVLRSLCIIYLIVRLGSWGPLQPLLPLQPLEPLQPLTRGGLCLPRVGGQGHHKLVPSVPQHEKLPAGTADNRTLFLSFSSQSQTGTSTMASAQLGLDCAIYILGPCVKLCLVATSLSAAR